jgi:predicted unusual protein kinase regulating ubiquinone biosynthesis (AarF/ABC1/UbiB family)
MLRLAGKGLLVLSAAGGTAFSGLYAYDPGLRREFTFWRVAFPIIAHYRYVNWRYVDENEQMRQFEQLHLKYAKPVLDLFLSLGGLYIKMGQVV